MVSKSQLSLEDKAIQTLAEQILKAVTSNNSSSDKTYMSVVTNVNSDGTYVIRDRFGTERNVRSGLPNLTIGRGATVWIKEPAGDINKMHICGLNAGITTTTAASGNVYGTPSYNDGKNNNIINLDLSNYYTKAEVDTIKNNLSSTLTNYYSKSQIDTLLSQINNPTVEVIEQLVQEATLEIIATDDDIKSIFN